MSDDTKYVDVVKIDPAGKYVLIFQGALPPYQINHIYDTVQRWLEHDDCPFLVIQHGPTLQRLELDERAELEPPDDD